MANRAGRRILLVDDDELVLRGLGRVLQTLGFVVVCCRRGSDALDVLVCGDRDFAALITDVNMPAMSGPQLIAAVIAAGIELPCLLMSGQFVGSALDDRRLAKPFSIDELRAGLVSLGVSLSSVDHPNTDVGKS